MTEAAQGLRVFISYARRDCSAFAEELLQGLELAGFDPFLDRHDIAAGEDWETRLSNLIHSADTVVFVISPEAVGSERCAWEVDRAQALSKRIIPIVAIDVAEAQTPEALRRRNYIFFSQGHSFVGALGQLSKALRTDVEWIREHTRLGELAERWRAKAKAEPMLLRGSELEGAKAWLAAWKAPAPEPTNAHREFIGESEAIEAGRFGEERKRLEEMAAAQAEKEHALRRFRRAVIVGVFLTGALAVATAIGALNTLTLQSKLTEAEIELVSQARQIEAMYAEISERERQLVLDSGGEVSDAPDPVVQRLERIQAELPRAEPRQQQVAAAPAAVPANTRLSLSFTLADLTISETARQQNLDNSPTAEQVENLRHTAAQLELVRAALNNAPIRIVSAFRSPQVHAAVGGLPSSGHTTGFDVDLTAASFGTPYEIVQALAASPEVMRVVDQIILENDRWVHISFAHRRRGEVLTAYWRPETGRRNYYRLGLHRLDENGYLLEEPPPQQQSGPAQRSTVPAHPTEP